MTTRYPVIELGDVLTLDLRKVPVDTARTYEMVGVYSFGRGLFARDPVQGHHTSYKYFYQLSADHIVMSQLFGWEGALALSNDDFAGRYVSPQFPTFKCDEKRLRRNFLGWMMKRPTFWTDLGSRASGIGDRRRTLSPDALFKSTIPLPALEEQDRLITKIEQLSVKLSELERLRAAVQDDLKSLCRSILLNSESLPTSMSELLRLRQPDLIVDSSQQYNFAGVYCFGRGVFRSVTKIGAEFSYNVLTRIRAGEFIYPKLMAWEGALAVVPPACAGLVVSPEYVVFEINTDRVLPETLDVYFRMPSVWPELASISNGTNVRRRRLHPSAFLDYRMPLPTMNVQQKLQSVLQSVSAITLLRQGNKAAVTELSLSILDKAYQGELK